MKILNLGSINIDHVYSVEHFVHPGETLGSRNYSIFAGGKGFNQSIALARAGASVCHAGMVGQDGGWLLDRLNSERVDTAHVAMGDTPTGHAIIQVVPSGENAIFLFGGANQKIGVREIKRALAASSPGDLLLTQNETSAVGDAIRMGKDAGLRVSFNPAPMNAAARDYPLECVDVFILNETEAEDLTGETIVEKIRSVMSKEFPNAATILTLGSRGAVFFDANSFCRQAASKVDAVDTTAAGDTFIGYFLSEWAKGGDAQEALALGCHASAICVMRAGAFDSIPHREEVKRLKRGAQ